MVRVRHTTANGSVTLGYWMCYLLDSQMMDHGEIYYLSTENSTIYRCPFTTKSLFRDTDYRPCLFLFVLISIFAIFGVIFNAINIIVLKNIPAKESFPNRMLILLAIFDFIASLFAGLATATLQVITDNVSRSLIVMVLFKSFFLLYSFGRTGSVFVTILIAIERFIFIAYPFQAKSWLTSRRRLAIFIGFSILIVSIDLSWWLNSYVQVNDVNKWTDDELSEYPYIFTLTWYGVNVYYAWLRPYHIFVDFVLPLPLPLLLLFNGLLYKFIHDSSRERETLQPNHKGGDVNATKMLSWVILILFFCHCFSVVEFTITEYAEVIYREIHLVTILAITVNAAINIFIYYKFSQNFRESFWKLSRSKAGYIIKRKGDKDEDNLKNNGNIPLKGYS